MNTDIVIEPLLDPENYRMSLYPIQYEDIWDLYCKHVAAFWVPNELKLSDDINDWNQLDKEEQHFLLTILAFFACSDYIVNENLDTEFCEHITIPEVKMFYHFQEMIEDIHTQTYQTLIHTFVHDEPSKKNLFDSIKTHPQIKAKADWARNSIATGSFVERLLVFACVEGIFFSSSFCSIFWCKKRGILPGLSQSNELISRDEGMHRDMSCLLYTKYIRNKCHPSKVIQYIKQAVQLEQEFVNSCLPYHLQGMNETLMNQYVKFVADHLALCLIGERIYHTENPFSWMDLISLTNKTNFFEKAVSEYSKASVITNPEESFVRFDVDF
jgi:ribonucleoside-diphosphate reductase beta chain